MKRLRHRFKAILYISIVTLFLLAGFLPLQNTHAQGKAATSHKSSQNNSCSSPCANTPVVLKDKQKAVDENQDDEPEPPEKAPHYAQIHSVFSVPKKLSNGYFGNASVLRPPDLVKLYANYRF